MKNRFADHDIHNNFPASFGRDFAFFEKIDSESEYE